MHLHCKKVVVSVCLPLLYTHDPIYIYFYIYIYIYTHTVYMYIHNIYKSTVRMSTYVYVLYIHVYIKKFYFSTTVPNVIIITTTITMKMTDDDGD